MKNLFLKSRLNQIISLKNSGIFIINCAFLIIQTINVNCKPDYSNNDSLYKAAVKDACLPDSSKVYNHLVQVAHKNKMLKWKKIDNEDYLLVSTWTYIKDFKQITSIDTIFPYEKWVTTVPELKNRIKSYVSDNHVLRAEQLLGLPPNTGKNCFVEFWVRPVDLFRACPDAEIDDSKCEICFRNAVNHDDSLHIAWINSTRISLYFGCGTKYPWTQLGYTYDWNPENNTHVGLSEFILHSGSKVYIDKIIATEEYLK